MSEPKNCQLSPKVFIVILNYNNLDVMNNCLESVSAIDYPNFEIILVDNHSTDGSFEKAKEAFPQVTYFQNSDNLGFSAGNNVGIRHALKNKAEFVLLLNNDTVVEKDFLAKLVESAQKNPQAGILCPLIYGPDMKKVWFSRGKIDWMRMKTIHETKIFPKKAYSSEFISGCTMLIPAKVFEKTGLLDEAYFLYWEDADFCVKVRKAGFQTLVIPASVIYHFEVSERTSEKKTYWLVFSGLLFFKKNCPWFLRLWIFFYVKMRKINNWVKRVSREDKLAEVVHNAYKDFENAKF